MALMIERFEEAETFFEAATCTESKSVVAWTMLGNTKCLLTTAGHTGTYDMLGHPYPHWTSVPGWGGEGGGRRSNTPSDVCQLDPSTGLA